jgi:hypothetical protein
VHRFLVYFHSKQRSKNQSFITSLRLKAKNHTIYLQCYTSFHHCIVRFLPSTLHLVAPLLHSHLASNSNTHNKQKKTTQRFQYCQTPRHLHLVILLVSTPLRANTASRQQKKKNASLKNPKTTFYSPLITLKLETCYIKTRNGSVQWIEDYMLPLLLVCVRFDLGCAYLISRIPLGLCSSLWI